MSGDLAVELRRHEQQGSTGVLLAGDGGFHLAHGTIASAHCHRATGLDRLVVEAGVATPEDWRRAWAGDPRQVLEQPQLESLALLSVYDAAYFLLSSGAEPEFRPAPAHWLSRVCHVRPGELVRECERRGDPGSGPWPAEFVDRVPVVPARRVRRRRVVLTAGQAEVLAAADTRRSVTEIGRYLGRTTYGCLREVSELTVAGLIEPPEPESDSPEGGVRTAPPQVCANAALPPAVPRIAAPMTGTVSPPSTPSRTENARGRLPAEPKGAPPVMLRRRRRRAVPAAERERWQQVDTNVLVRVRAALEELA